MSETFCRVCAGAIPYTAKLCAECASEKIDRLTAEIEQLRQFQASLHPTELRDYTKTYYVINDDMIDAAWAYLEDDDILANYLNSSFVVENTLAMLNIHRCTCNDGIYTEGNDDSSQTQEYPCNLCGGRGWIAK